MADEKQFDQFIVLADSSIPWFFYFSCFKPVGEVVGREGSLPVEINGEEMISKM